MNRFVFLSICICAAVTAHLDIEDPLQVLSVGNRQFAVAIYKELLKENEDNIVFSPLSAEVILALTSEGAKGDTRTELVNGLYLPQAPGEIQKCFKEVLPQLQVNNDKVKLFSANKMYARNDVEFEKEFKQIAVDVFKSDIENVDFHQVAKACDTINEWVESQTNHKIKNLLSPDVVSTDTVLILVNTLYLNAKWISSFDEVATTNENFFLTSTKTVEKPIMQKVQYTNYHESKELKAQFLELPYQLDGLSMVFVLPDDTDGLATLENNIEAVFQPREWQKETVSIKLPRFTINSGINFNDILKSLGVKKLFNDADLTGLSVNYKDLTVSQVVQKAFINVTEGGTEAAAATAVISFIRSGHALPVVTKTFHATHPFIYLIKYYDLILFAGKYSS